MAPLRLEVQEPPFTRFDFNPKRSNSRLMPLDAIDDADDTLADLQDSMMPVEVGDAELRAGLSAVRELIGQLQERAPSFLRTLGR